MRRYRKEQAPLAILAAAQFVVQLRVAVTRDACVLAIVSFVAALASAVSMTISNREREELDDVYPQTIGHRVQCWEAKARVALMTSIVGLTGPAYAAIIAWRDDALSSAALAGMTILAVAYREWVFPWIRKGYRSQK